MKAKHLQRGEDAETQCCQYLLTQGLKLVSTNFNCRYGEIDIIMLDKNTLVFVEVRYRKNQLFGDGLASVTLTKQNKLRKTAEFFLQNNTTYCNARFDVVSMSSNPSTKNQPNYTFDWVPNAF